MADKLFEDPRLAVLYDLLVGDRDDLDLYLALVAEVGARRVVDIGCGTGTLALLLADRGIAVTGIDPAGSSLDVARTKPGADRVRWVHGDATVTPVRNVDAVTMTGNVAQAIAEPQDWSATLGAIAGMLRPGGHLIFETRIPERRAWLDWTRAATLTTADLPGGGTVEHWVEVADVAGPLVSFRGTYRFSDGVVLTSDSTLRFRERAEVEDDLAAHGLAVHDVRDAPDRPGREYVYVVQRAD